MWSGFLKSESLRSPKFEFENLSVCRVATILVGRRLMRQNIIDYKSEALDSKDETCNINRAIISCSIA